MKRLGAREDTVKTKLLALAPLALVAACAIPQGFEAGHDYAVQADPAFTAEERAQLAAALDEWRAASGGKISAHLVDGPGEIVAHRGAGPDGSACHVARKVGPEAWFDPDAMASWSPGGLERCALNVVGKLAGVPRAFGEPDPLNDDAFGDQTRLTEKDVALCRAVELCP